MLDKKYIISILIIILIIGCSLGLYFYSQFQVGSAYLSLPSGYHAETHNDGVVNLTNGNDFLILNEYSGYDPDIMVPINYYMGSKENQNFSVELLNFNVDDIKVYKTILNNGTDVYHYWFIKNHKLYEFVTYDGHPDTDNIVSSLIKSMRSSII